MEHRSIYDNRKPRELTPGPLVLPDEAWPSFRNKSKNIDEKIEGSEEAVKPDESKDDNPQYNPKNR